MTQRSIRGLLGKLLKDITYATFKTNLALTKSDVNLGSVDNTSDANKPVSGPQGAAIALKADLASPALTGNPTAPTPSPGDADTSVATTAFVSAAVTAATSLIPQQGSRNRLMTATSPSTSAMAVRV